MLAVVALLTHPAHSRCDYSLSFPCFRVPDPVTGDIPGGPDFVKFTDYNGHGTNVAGILGVVGNNGLGSTGVAQVVSLK